MIFPLDSIYKGFSMAILNDQMVPIVPNQSLLNKLLPVRVMSTSLPETVDHSWPIGSNLKLDSTENHCQQFLTEHATDRQSEQLSIQFVRGAASINSSHAMFAHPVCHGKLICIYIYIYIYIYIIYIYLYYFYSFVPVAKNIISIYKYHSTFKQFLLQWIVRENAGKLNHGCRTYMTFHWYAEIFTDVFPKKQLELCQIQDGGIWRWGGAFKPTSWNNRAFILI